MGCRYYVRVAGQGEMFLDRAGRSNYKVQSFDKEPRSPHRVEIRTFEWGAGALFIRLETGFYKGAERKRLQAVLDNMNRIAREQGFSDVGVDRTEEQ